MPRGTKHRANGEGSIFAIETPQGKRWRAEATIGYDETGKRIVATGTGATKALAIERRDGNRLKLLVLQGKAPVSSLRSRDVRIRKQTVAEYLEIWFGNIDPATVGESTRRAHRSKIDLHITPHIGSIPLVLLTKQDVMTLFYQTLPNKAYDPKHPEKRLSSGAIKNVWKPLYKALTEAVNDGLLPKHPMTGISKPRETQDEVKVDGTKQTELLRNLEGNLDQAKWLLTFLLGLRVSEKLGLTWDCLNLKPAMGKPATIEIKQQLARSLSTHGCGKRTDQKYPCGKRSAEHCPKRIEGKGLYIKRDTKTTAGNRVLPLPTKLQGLLIEHKERWDSRQRGFTVTWTSHDHGKDTEYTFPKWEPLKGLENLVFSMPDGKPISQQQENRDWHALCEKYGFDTERNHLNRHTTATMLAEAGVPPETAKMILGHNSERMVAYYTHLKATKHTLEPLQELEKTLLERTMSAAKRPQRETDILNALLGG
jgi:integrase